MRVQKKGAGALLASFLLAALATQAFLAVVVSARSGPMEKASQDDVKKPDCVPAFDPHSFPGHGGTTVPVPSHGGSGTTPSHGGSGTTPSHGGTGTTPSQGGSGTTPSHGGSGTTPSRGGTGTTPSQGGSGTTPSHGGSGSTMPDPSHGGGGYGSTPTAPSHGGYGSIPSPSHGGHGTSAAAPSTGGGYGSTPTPSHGGAYGSSPTPSQGGAYGSSPTPSHGGAYGGTPPAYGGSPATPSHGDGHGTATATPLVPVDPNSPGTCDYWRTHPMEIWSALGRWPSSVGHFFGAAAGGPNVSIQDALANTRSDGAGALLREGTAALLNSMTRTGFPYTTEQVRDAFAAAAAAGGSDGAAETQAAAFKKANEGRA